MTRKKIVAGNWKMNCTLEKGIELVKELAAAPRPSGAALIVCPPFIHLPSAAGLLQGTGIGLGAQNLHTEERGAFTGEISAEMLCSAGVTYVLIGHSERREYAGEDHKLLAQKTQRALSAGLNPIFCCGEPLAIRQAETQVAFVKKQLEESLFQLEAADFDKLVIAYEPIWAIGTGLTASSEQAQAMHLAIRNMIAERYTAELSENISILYGGSCKPGNAPELFACPDVDGGLIGGAALKAADFLAIANSF